MSIISAPYTDPYPVRPCPQVTTVHANDMHAEGDHDPHLCPGIRASIDALEAVNEEQIDTLLHRMRCRHSVGCKQCTMDSM
jgi:hypothetical protein